MKKVKLSLTIKNICYIIFLMLCISVVVSYLIINHERALLLDQLKQRGISIAQSTANNSSYGVFTEDREILDGFIHSAIQKDVRYVSICNVSGKILACSRRDLVGTIDVKINRQHVKGIFENEIINTEFDIQVPIKITPPESISMSTELLLASLPRKIEKDLIGFVRLVISMEDINTQTAIARKQIIIVNIIFIIIALTVSFLVTQSIITLPLQELVRLTQEVAKGNLDVKAREKSSDEVGQLAGAFNRMTQDLKSSRNEVESYSKTLEDKVVKRTKELTETNEQLKKAQAELIQSAKMTAIGQLGAGVAHELNNPLGGILGYAQYVLQKMESAKFDEDDLTTSKKYLGYIERETKRCKYIVENLLSFSRKSHEIKETDVKKVVEDTLSLLHHQIQNKGVTITFDYDEDLALVHANGNQLQQVFTNLILNAQQSMIDGGEVAIIARNVKLENNEIKEIEIRFIDTGCGIPEENLSRIFEPFFTTKREWKGTGLGLSVTYEIISAHEGRINVESQEGIGSIFIINLPCIK